MTDPYQPYHDQMAACGFVGHAKALEFFSSALADKSKHSSNCFMLTGPKGSGKKMLAKWFATKASFHMDITELEYTRDVKIEAFFDLFASMGYGARQGKVKTYIIDVVEPMTVLVGNALLKRLEEVMQDVCIFLVVPDSSYMPPTVQSRSKVIEFGPLTHAEADFILTRTLKYSQADADVMRQCFGTNMALMASTTVAEAIEIRDYVYENVGEMAINPYSMIEMYNLAWYMARQCDHYLAVILNWASSFINDPTHGIRFSLLCKELLALDRHDQNLELWLQRAFIRYMGWTLPPIVTPYETLK